MRTKEALIELLIKEGFLKTPRIIEAFRAIDRADFVPEELKNEAYGNYPLPIGYGQTISQPLTVAFMLELLKPQSGEKMLDIGSGSGWTTALLAHMASGNHESRMKPACQNINDDGNRGYVLGIERISELCACGQKNLAKYFDESRAKIACGDGKNIQGNQFNKILSGAAAQKNIPDWWRRQLTVGGRIVAPIGNSIWLFTKKFEMEWEEKEYPGFAFVPLT